MASGLRRTWKLYIDGKWSDASGGTFDVLNPATEEGVAQAPNGTRADLDRGCVAGRGGLEGRWFGVGGQEAHRTGRSVTRRRRAS